MAANTPDQPQLTRAAHDRLRDELDELRGEGRRKMADRLQRARELGDLSENAEYHAAREEQAMMEARIRKLEHLLRHAEIVEAPAAAETAVAGTLVTLRGLESGEEEVYLLAGSNEERSAVVHTVTIGSPLGQAIAGARVGEKVTYNAPGGTFSYEVAGLRPWEGDDR